MIGAIVVVVGIALILLAAVGEQPIDNVDIGLVGIAMCFAARYIPDTIVINRPNSNQ